MFDSADLLEGVLENDPHKHCDIQCVVDYRYRKDLQKVCELASLGNYILRQSSYVEEI